MIKTSSTKREREREKNVKSFQEELYYRITDKQGGRKRGEGRDRGGGEIKRGRIGKKLASLRIDLLTGVYHGRRERERERER